jgi:hypothetical protein
MFDMYNSNKKGGRDSMMRPHLVYLAGVGNTEKKTRKKDE